MRGRPAFRKTLKTYNNFKFLKINFKFLSSDLATLLSGRYIQIHVLPLSFIADSLTSAGRPVSNVTIDKYLDALTACFVLYPAQRFDLKGKRILQTHAKYYLVDMDLRSLLTGKPMSNYGRILGNLVFLELKRRYEDVWIGKNNGGEIDFVVKTESGGLAYYQVAQSIRDEQTKRRELSALEAVKDNYPKFLLTLDFETNDHNGIRQLNAIDWLLGKKAP